MCSALDIPSDRQADVLRLGASDAPIAVRDSTGSWRTPVGLALAIDPLVRFGRPAVSGVAIERLWELYDAGESVDEIASGCEMSRSDVRAAIAYEEQFRSLAA